MRWTMPCCPSKKSRAKTRVMDDVFINEQGNHVTPAFVSYLRPLLGANLAQAHRLALHRIEKASDA
jgi:hypothetical protein